MNKLRFIDMGGLLLFLVFSFSGATKRMANGEIFDFRLPGEQNRSAGEER